MTPRPSPYRPPAPVEADPQHPCPQPGQGLAATIAELRRQAARLRQSSIDWITRDHQRARQLLRQAEKLEERVVLLEAASRVGAPASHQPFRRHFAGGPR